MREVKAQLEDIWVRLKKREIEDRHYISYKYQSHEQLAKEIASLDIWSVMLFGCRDVNKKPLISLDLRPLATMSGEKYRLKSIQLRRLDL